MPAQSLSAYLSSRSSESERIQILEAAAARDAERIAELEKYRAQALYAQELKNGAQAAQAALQAQMAATLHESAAEKDKLEAQAMALNQTFELMSVDKDIAEERVRGLEEQVLELKGVADGACLCFSFIYMNSYPLCLPPVDTCSSACATGGL